MTWLEIRPQDVWLFRDGKPFSAGEDHSANSMFPPTAFTLQGALRQKISVSLGVSLRQYKNASNGKPSTKEAEQAVDYIGRHGTLADTGMFAMGGPFIGLRIEEAAQAKLIPLLPTPADLFKDKTTHDFYISRPYQPLSSDLEPEKAQEQEPDESILFPEVREEFENLPGYWMAADVFANYLAGNAPGASHFFGHLLEGENQSHATLRTTYLDGKRIWSGGLIYRNENRFGVSTNALTSFREEGQLYQVQFVRLLDGVSLLTSVTDSIPANLLSGPIQIGGEQRRANVTIVPDIRLPAKPETISDRFKVIFLTPAYFDAGWEPIDRDWSKVFGETVKLKSAVLYRPLKIGGWDTARNRARTMHNYVTPGSVYYFETKRPLNLPDALTQDPPDINAKVLGFGQYALGSW
jgi:CRISPR-associated protein Cmr3